MLLQLDLKSWKVIKGAMSRSPFWPLGTLGHQWVVSSAVLLGPGGRVAMGGLRVGPGRFSEEPRIGQEVRVTSGFQICIIRHGHPYGCGKAAHLNRCASVCPLL
jgi:hypothetical protein